MLSCKNATFCQRWYCCRWIFLRFVLFSSWLRIDFVCLVPLLFTASMENTRCIVYTVYEYIHCISSSVASSRVDFNRFCFCCCYFASSFAMVFCVLYPHLGFSFIRVCKRSIDIKQFCALAQSSQINLHFFLFYRFRLLRSESLFFSLHFSVCFIHFFCCSSSLFFS